MENREIARNVTFFTLIISYNCEIFVNSQKKCIFLIKKHCICWEKVWRGNPKFEGRQGEQNATEEAPVEETEEVAE